jgi:antitoxin HicB
MPESPERLSYPETTGGMPDPDRSATSIGLCGKRRKAADMSSPKYTIIIQWSEEDDCYVASLPEWGPYCKAYGDSYEDAAKQAHEVLDLLMEDETGLSPLPPRPQPEPKLFHYPGADVVNLPDTEGDQVPSGVKRQTA